MPDSPTQPSPLQLWLTDRTRSAKGLGRCPRDRYLSSNFGPTGYGIVPAAESLPLATGLGAHAGLEGLATIVKRHDRLPTLEETRVVVRAAQVEYRAKVEAKGFLGILQGAQTDEIITEQETLISGLIWAMRLKFVPWLHQTYKVISIEEERLHFLSCTCGAGPLPSTDHIQRGCQGIVLMLRRDLIAQHRVHKTLAYFECKTTGWESSAWAEQWETTPQLALGTLDCLRDYGAEVTELYILGLNKGRRMREKAAGEDSRKLQMSALCYGYCRPGNPPLAVEDWLPGYEWTDDAGEIKRASRAHKRKGIWELAESDWPTWRAYHQQEPDMTPGEFWVRMLPTSVLDKVCFLLGPMNRQDQQLESLRTSMLADEQRWQEALWTLYERQQQQPWASVEFQQTLDALVPCSWNCRPFGKEHQCAFVPVCHRQQGWEDPLASGRYQPRRPHHTPELQQAVARGLLVEQAAEEPDEGDE